MGVSFTAAPFSTGYKLPICLIVNINVNHMSTGNRSLNGQARRRRACRRASVTTTTGAVVLARPKSNSLVPDLVRKMWPGFDIAMDDPGAMCLIERPGHDIILGPGGSPWDRIVCPVP